MSSSGSAHIEALGRDNYDVWKLKIRAVLVKNGVWGYVNGTLKKPDLTTDEDVDKNDVQKWLTNDEKALSDIVLTLSDNQLMAVKHCQTSREMWLKLESINQSKGPARKATLLKGLMMQKMTEGSDVRDHLNKFFGNVDKLSEMDVRLDPDQLTIQLLYSLPPSFESFRIAIESRDELPTVENLRTKIIEENDARNNASSVAEGAMFVKKKAPGKKYPPKPARNSNQRSDKDTFFPYKCSKCGIRGHKAVDCKGKGKKNKTEDVSMLAILEKGDTCQIATSGVEDSWCLDSGCTSHLCSDAMRFTELDKSETGRLRLASSATAEIRARGTARIATSVNGQRRNVTLNEVLHVPETRTNLLSVSRITDRGFSVVFDKKKAEIFDRDGVTHMIANRKDNLYYVQATPLEGCQTAVSGADRDKDLAQLWHRRMGHVNFRDLIAAARSGAIRGLELKGNLGDLVCDVCTKCKMTRKSFPKESDRVTSKLEVIHTDVCGPTRVASHSGSRYVITFTDDYSRWTEVRFMKSKGEAFQMFREYKALVEKQHGLKIKCVRSDNGREYENRAFDDFLKFEGIRRELTTTHTPEQNGVSERKNRTLEEAARCLLLQSGLPQSFWAEALNTANYLRNRCPTKKLNGKTPFEYWHGKEPTAHHLRDFGSKVFCLDKTPNKGKFDRRSKEGLLVGYSEQSKAYRVWIPETRTTEVTRDVVFREEMIAHDGTVGDIFPQDHGDEVRVEPNNQVHELEFELIPRDEFRVERRVVQDQPDIDELDGDLEFPEGFRGFAPDEIDDPDQEIRPAEQPATPPADRQVSPPTRGPGRPKLVRTGGRGRPRKLYCVQPGEAANVAEVPVNQAVSGEDSAEWLEAMAEEAIALIRNNTWKLVGRPKGQRVIGSRFVLRNKHNADGTISKRKARVVARGFAQRPGIEFHDTFAPVARLSTIRTAVAIAVQDNLKIRQLDVKTAYLNGEVEEQIFMETPAHFKDVLAHIVQDEKIDKDVRKKADEMLKKLTDHDVVCLLGKALYGLKQAGRAWYHCIDGEIMNLGATRSDADPCLYFIGPVEDRTHIIIYVDDILIMSRTDAKIDEVRDFLNTKFEIKDLGDVRYCLGLEFERGANEMKICQTGYINEVLERFGMSECRPVSTPMEPGTKLQKEDEKSDEKAESFPYRQLVGALMYLSVGTRPDISHAVSALSQFNDRHEEQHWKAAKRVLRYLAKTRDLGLLYSKSDDPAGMFVDADWGNCIVDRKSYTGYAFIMSGAAVSWESRKQPTVALSSTEAEYMALSDATKEALYMRRMLNDFGKRLGAVPLRNDNIGAQKLVSNPMFHSRTKHIDIRHHSVRDAKEKGMISVEYTPTDEMPADVLTKGLSRPKHEKCVQGLGLGSRGPG